MMSFYKILIKPTNSSMSYVLIHLDRTNPKIGWRIRILIISDFYLIVKSILEKWRYSWKIFQLN